MKKLLLAFAASLLVTTVWAQSQLTTVRGKTKEGKTIKVEYYQGTVEDYVESVRYQLVDELQARVTELQTKLDAANKQVKELKTRNQGGDKEKQISELYGQIDVLSGTIRNLNQQLIEKNISLDSIATVNQGLQQQVAQNTTIKPVAVGNKDDKELKRLRDSIVSKDATIHQLNMTLTQCERRVDNLENELVAAQSRPAGYPVPSPVIGVQLGLGPVFMRDELAEGWAGDVNWAKEVEVYFGTARLSSSFPVSIEAGVGIRSFKLSASATPTEVVVNATDIDGEAYQAIYSYGARTESLALTYLDIPVRICLGQPAKGMMGVYAKLGITPSIKMSSGFAGSGKYSLKGYYPQWDVTLENITELGFGSDMECYDDVEPELGGFLLWGNLMLGGYMPFGKSAPVLLNCALGLDFPFMGVGTAAKGMGLLGNGGKVVVPSFEIGVVYSIK